MFSVQGAVSSSSNIIRKKNDAIYKNNASLKTTYKNGIMAINNVYDTESGTGYHLNYLKGDTNNSKCKDCQKELNSIRNKRQNILKHYNKDLSAVRVPCTISCIFQHCFV